MRSAHLIIFMHSELEEFYEEHPQGSLPCRRPGHPFSSRDESATERDAADR
jgi:hypothetical protein